MTANSPEARLARAVFSQAVTDLYDKRREIAFPASRWLFDDEDGDSDAWRDHLATLGDINLDNLRRIAGKAVRAKNVKTLRALARMLDKGGSW